MNETVTHLEPKAPADTPAPAPALAVAPAASTAGRAVTVIEPSAGLDFSGLREVWRFRELFLYLAWRDIKIRFKQTVLGIGWAVAQPVATMLIFSLSLGRMNDVADRIEHYPLFVFAGLIGWFFFINTVTAAGNSVIANERLITKVYFPRLIIPLATVGVSVFDLLIGSVLLGAMMLVYGVAPGWNLLLLPLVMLALGIASVGLGVLFSALIVAQRDFKYILTFAAQLWMLATPCIFLSENALGGLARTWLPLNPAYGLVLAFRQCVLGGVFDWYSFGLSAAVGGVVFVAAVLYFRHTERYFADLI